MPIKIIQKPKTKPKPKTKAGQKHVSEVSTLVDDAGVKQDAWKEVEAKSKELKKEFDGAFKEFYDLVVATADEAGIMTPDDNPSWSGEVYEAEASKIPVTRHVADLKGVFVALENVKEGLALELMSFKLGDLDKYLTKEQLKGLVKPELAKKRKLTFRKKAKIVQD